jgi:hypothetical protein
MSVNVNNTVAQPIPVDLVSGSLPTAVTVNNTLLQPVPVNIVSGGGGAGDVNVTNSSLPIAYTDSGSPVAVTGATPLPVMGLVSVSAMPSVALAAGSAVIGTVNLATGSTVSLASGSALPAGSAHLGEVSVSNFPSFPSVQSVSGTVAVSNSVFPVAFTSGASSVAVTGITPLPVVLEYGTSNVGNVAISNFPSTQDVILTTGTSHVGEVSVSALPSLPAGTAHLGEVSVSNFPAFPTTQPVSGTLAISNFPSTQAVSGTISVSNFPGPQPTGLAQMVYSLNCAYSPGATGIYVVQKVLPSVAAIKMAFSLSVGPSVLSAPAASTSLWALVAVAASASAPTSFPGWTPYATGSSFGSYTAGLGATGSLSSTLPCTVITPVCSVESMTFQYNSHEKLDVSTFVSTLSAAFDLYLVGYLLASAVGVTVSRIFQVSLQQVD